MEKRPYQQLIAWQQAHRLCLMIYQLSKSFPADERFGLVSQIRRAAHSVPTNIAEGNSRRSPKEKGRFFEIALGSLDEVHYQCILARDLDYINGKELIEINRTIEYTSVLITKLRAHFKKS